MIEQMLAQAWPSRDGHPAEIHVLVAPGGT